MDRVRILSEPSDHVTDIILKKIHSSTSGLRKANSTLVHAWLIIQNHFAWQYFLDSTLDCRKIKTLKISTRNDAVGGRQDQQN